MTSAAGARGAFPDLPCLSIRQPWAWLIVNGHKDIENRDWPTRFRGDFLVHASKGMTRDEYEIADNTAAGAGETDIYLPPFETLERGGIVGMATILDCVADSLSPWFFGRYGFVLDNMKPLPFTPCRGMLGFFRPDFSPPEKRVEAKKKPKAPKPQLDLFAMNAPGGTGGAGG